MERRRPEVRVLPEFRVLMAWLLLALTIAPALAEDYPGLEGEIRVVTSLADSGPGSLREAIAARNPRLIVFAVAGRIELRSPLAIRHGAVTIAGETAPSPGITIAGNTLQVSASDVHLRHLRVRVGAGTDQPKDNLDGIRLLGHASGRRLIERVVIAHCSVSWAVDEGISLWRPPIRSVTIRDTIISEMLGNAGHSKGQHSMGLLIGPGMGPVRIQRNLFAHNRYRNPVLTSGSRVLVSDNVIYNYGRDSIHSYERKDAGPLRATITGNVVIPGPASERGPFLDLRRINAGSQVYMVGNTTLPTADSEALPLTVRGDVAPAAWPPWGLEPPDSATPPRDLVAAILDAVGARPWDRDATDRRIIQNVRDGTGAVIDAPPEAELGALAVSRPLILPAPDHRLEWLRSFVPAGG